MPLHSIPPDLRTAAQNMRLAFDDTFAHAQQTRQEETVDLLLVRLGETVQALRLDGLAHLQRIKAVTPLPSPEPTLMGVTTFHGEVLPVYDLRRLVGASAAQAPGWLAIAKAMPVALAFDEFISHTRCPVSALSGSGSAPQTVLVQVRGRPTPLLNLAAVLHTIQNKAPAGAAREEP